MSLFTFPASGTEVLQPGIDSKALAGESKHDDADDFEDEDEVLNHLGLDQGVHGTFGKIEHHKSSKLSATYFV